MLRLMRAEFTKLRTTASFWWTAGLAAFFMLAFNLGFAYADHRQGPASEAPEDMFGAPASLWDPTLIIAGYSFYLFVLCIMAVMIVTTEYRFKMPQTNFAITPSRWKVAVAKLLVYVVFGVLFGLFLLLVSYVVGDAMAANPINWMENDVVRRSLWTLPITTALTITLCQGAGWILRNSAGALALVLAWQLVVEGIVLPLIPKWGTKILDFMPFQARTFFEIDFPYGRFDPWTYFGIFAAWAIILWVIGLILLERRDA